MYRIATNTCISFTRKKSATREVPLNDIEEVYGYEDESSLVRKYLERAVHLLPPKQKSIFLLHDVQGFTHAEIAGIMHLREGTIKSQLFKARMKLRESLGGQT
jgi:RNA polymerase sigma-70 factor (ECF subfamily)